MQQVPREYLGKELRLKRFLLAQFRETPLLGLSSNRYYRA